MRVNTVNGWDNFSRVNSLAATPTSMAWGNGDREVFRLFDEARRISFRPFQVRQPCRGEKCIPSRLRSRENCHRHSPD